MMKIDVVETGYFKLDGGAMFGVVPKQMWNKLNPADEKNMCTWSMRCLLIQSGYRKILVDTGMGTKQNDKFRSHFEPFGPYDLITSIEDLGVPINEITDVFLTHLHFDHVGGALYRDESDNIVPTFPNATYWTNERHLAAALAPNAREKASFLVENILPLKEAGVLEFIPEVENYEFLPGIHVNFSFGHTEAMMILDIEYKGRHIVYCADQCPSAHHIGLPYVMSYDIHPLISIEEKKILTERALERGDILFFEHDPVNECGTVKQNNRGRIVVDKLGTLEELLASE